MRLAPPKLRLVRHPNLLRRLRHSLALADHHVGLTQLVDDLFRRVSLSRHLPGLLLPFYGTSTWTKISGSRHNLKTCDIEFTDDQLKKLVLLTTENIPYSHSNAEIEKVRVALDAHLKRRDADVSS